jgi:signal transduction histidine kinase
MVERGTEEGSESFPDDEDEPERSTRRIAEGAVLAASAADDMSGPLSYVLSNLEYVDRQLGSLERDLPPGRVEGLRHCLREATAGANRVRDILDYLRQPRGHRGPESDIDIHRVLLSCIKIARTQVDHRARVITDFDAVPPVLGSETQISRLFVNLLVNAAQAVAGEPDREHFIRVSTRNDGEQNVVIEITDSGPGIPEEHLGRLFEPFFTTKPANEGTGLGLATCLRIVEELGGSIGVDSPPGQGASFRVTLPAPRERITDRAPAAASAVFVSTRPPVRRLPTRQLG